MERFRNIFILTLMVFVIAFSGCNTGTEDDLTSEDTISADGQWYVTATLQGTPCFGVTMPLEGPITVVENDDDTFAIYMSDESAILKGTRSGNELTIDTITVGDNEYKNIVTGTITLISDEEFEGTITTRSSDTCADVYQITGSR